MADATTNATACPFHGPDEGCDGCQQAGADRAERRIVEWLRAEKVNVVGRVWAERFADAIENGEHR